MTYFNPSSNGKNPWDPPTISFSDSNSMHNRSINSNGFDPFQQPSNGPLPFANASNEEKVPPKKRWTNIKMKLLHLYPFRWILGWTPQLVSSRKWKWAVTSFWVLLLLGFAYYTFKWSTSMMAYAVCPSTKPISNSKMQCNCPKLSKDGVIVLGSDEFNEYYDEDDDDDEDEDEDEQPKCDPKKDKKCKSSSFWSVDGLLSNIAKTKDSLIGSSSKKSKNRHHHHRTEYFDMDDDVEAPDEDEEEEPEEEEDEDEIKDKRKSKKGKDKRKSNTDVDIYSNEGNKYMKKVLKKYESNVKHEVKISQNFHYVFTVFTEPEWNKGIPQKMALDIESILMKPEYAGFNCLSSIEAPMENSKQTAVYPYFVTLRVAQTLESTSSSSSSSELKAAALKQPNRSKMFKHILYPYVQISKAIIFK